MNIYIIVHPVIKDIKKVTQIKDDDYVIAVDSAYLACQKQGIKVDLTIGDFDTLSNYESIIEKDKYIKLNPIKDYSDTYYALEHAKSLNPKKIYLVGGIGGLRFEHTYANILLLINNPNLTIITNESEINILKEGNHKVKFDGYINIFSVKESLISLKGFKYDLNNYLLMPSNSVGLSNEILNNEGVITVSRGKLILIKTNYD